MGRQHIRADGHVAHDGGHNTDAQTPQHLVHQNGGGVFQEAPRHGPAGPQQQAEHQGHSAVAGGIDRDDHELQHPGGQGGNGSTGDPQRRRAELAENKNVVQARVGQHGDAEDDHAHGGILRAALHADVDGADGVEDIAEANNPEIGGAQLNEQVVVGHQSHHMEGEEEQHSGHGNRNDEPGVKADAHTAVDAVGVPLAPVLAGQDGESAEQAQDDDLEQVDGRVGGSDSGQLILPQHTHHEGVHKSQGSGDEILQDQRQSQQEQPLVEAGLPMKMTKHKRRNLLKLKSKIALQHGHPRVVVAPQGVRTGVDVALVSLRAEAQADHPAGDLLG